MNTSRRLTWPFALKAISLSAALFFTDSARAQSASSALSVAPEVAPATPARVGPYGRPFSVALGFVPLATFVGAAGSQPSDVLYPSDRFAIAQIVGGGYVLNPRFRFGAVAIFNEVLTGLPRGSSAWQFGGVAPIGIGTLNHVIIGGGPVFSYRFGGRRQSDVGLVVLTGASIPVRKGLAVNIVAPVTAVFAQRTTASIGLAAGVAKVF